MVPLLLFFVSERHFLLCSDIINTNAPLHAQFSISRQAVLVRVQIGGSKKFT